MKFQCDRCKTRYSIGEEKIRGKVLKIRCKNCSAVITVREGQSSTGGEGSTASPMPTPDAVAARKGASVAAKLPTADAGKGASVASKLPTGAQAKGGSVASKLPAAD